MKSERISPFWVNGYQPFSAIGDEEEAKSGCQSKPVSQSNAENPVRIWIDIRISNGLHLSQKNLSYQDLVRMIEKLEGLC